MCVSRLQTISCIDTSVPPLTYFKHLVLFSVEHDKRKNNKWQPKNVWLQKNSKSGAIKSDINLDNVNLYRQLSVFYNWNGKRVSPSSLQRCGALLPLNDEQTHINLSQCERANLDTYKTDSCMYIWFFLKKTVINQNAAHEAKWKYMYAGQLRNGVTGVHLYTHLQQFFYLRFCIKIWWCYKRR